ncbi:MAG: UvrD-helicase domain-containing protein [Acidimicrobiales bacterium]
MDSFNFAEGSASIAEATASGAAASPLLNGLNPQQFAAVTSDANRLCLIAGAGTGKTRVLTRRIAYRSATGSIDPRRVLAITFTRKAASELTRRLRQLGLRDDVGAGTFHGIAFAQLRARANETGRAEPKLLERKVGFVAKLLPRSDERTKPFDVVSEIEWAKARLISPEKYPEAIRAEGRDPTIDPQRLAGLFQDYEDRKNRMGLVDFDDLLGLTATELRRDRRWGDAQRWRFRYLFVDEFQDVNPLQFGLLKAWLGPQSELFVVGDPRQAIYGWNGADSRYITEFESHFGGAETLQLTQNYRSTPEILAAAEAVLDPSMSMLEPLKASRPPGPKPLVAGYESETDEAAGIARAVRDAHRPGGRWSDQAILTRTNGQLGHLEAALRTAGIPFRTRAGSEFLEQVAVKAILKKLSLRNDLRSTLADLAMPDGDGDVVNAPAVDLDRAAALATLTDLARDFLVIDSQGSGPRFIAWLHTAVGSDRHGTITDSVELATFHSAKGLEWPVVHIAGLEDGFVPIAFATTPAARVEERNLLHVATTRAQRELHCSWAKQRTFNITPVERSRSPFVEAIESANPIIDLREPLTDTVSTAISTARRALGSNGLSKVSPASLYSNLERWRSDLARSSMVEPHAVISDEELSRLAIVQPRTIEQIIERVGLSKFRAQRFGPSILKVLHPNASYEVSTEPDAL